ncbi:MAG: hypothetical protein ACYSYT_03855 [Planctomycetota bacterium]|jgi:hypothetical protein
MKTLVRLIAVFVALSVAAGSCVSAGRAGGDEDQLAIGKALEDEISEAKAEAERQKEIFKRELDKSKLVIYKDQAENFGKAAERTRRRSRTKRTGRHGRAETVLVIPTAETTTADLAAIMEDMGVMSRILDKKLGHRHGGAGHFFGGFDFGGSFPFSWAGHETKSVYLDGYGALFLLRVGFPLLPPPEVEAEEAAEPTDPVWEQTRQEIYEPTDAKSKSWYVSAEERERYDAEKVEGLKSGLVKTLKHAANIRNLEPKEWVILTVIGGESGSGGGISSAASIMVRDEGREIAISGPGMPPIPSDALLTDVGYSGPTVLTIRAKASDIEAFSAGKLDFDQFGQRVQIFTY